MKRQWGGARAVMEREWIGGDGIGEIQGGLTHSPLTLILREKRGERDSQKIKNNRKKYVKIVKQYNNNDAEKHLLKSHVSHAFREVKLLMYPRFQRRHWHFLILCGDSRVYQQCAHTVSR